MKASTDGTKSVAVIGSGTIGLCALLVARSRSIESVVVLDPIGEKLERAKSFGGQTIQLDPADDCSQISGKIEAELGHKPDLEPEKAPRERRFFFVWPVRP